jgi:hypothetical protein
MSFARGMTLQLQIFESLAIPGQFDPMLIKVSPGQAAGAIKTIASSA